MKKNFFKKLSFVMALAMIISVIAPAAGAFAATGAHLNATKKYLYLAEENRPTSFDFNIISKPAGAAKFVWTSSNADVASVESPSGVVTAEAKGTATIKVAIKDNAGKTLKTLSASVVVRDNIDTLKISNFTDKTVVKVGDTFDFDRTFTTFSGSTTATSSITRYAVDSDKATIDATTGKFTAKEAGEFNVTAYAFMSTYEYTKWLADKADSWVLAKDTVKVKVDVSLTKVELVTPTQLKLTFDSSVKDVVKAASDVSVNQVVTSTINALVPVKSLDSVSEDGKTVVVSVYDNLTNNVTYTVKAANSTKDFLAQIGTPVSISMSSQTVPANTATAVKFTMLDQYGVDVSSLFVGTVDKSSTVAINATTGVITLTNNQVAFVKYSYNIINTDGTVKTISTDTVTVTGVTAAITGTVSTNLYSSVTNSATAFGTAKTSLALGTTAYLNARALKSDGSYNYAGYTFENLTPSILVVDAATGLVTPIAVGNAVVKVLDSNSVVVGYASISVTATAATSSIKASATVVRLSNNISGAVAPQESATVTIKNVDQYGVETNAVVDAQTTADTTGSYVASATRTTDIATITPSGTNGVTFTAVAGKSGSFTYVVRTSEDKLLTISVTVGTPGVLNNYTISSTATSVDAYTTNADTNHDIDFTVYGMDATGLKQSLVTATSYTVTGPTGFATQTLTPDANGTVTFAADDTALAYPVGTYTLTVKVGGATGLTFAQQFTVANSRPAPSVKVNAVTFDVANNTTLISAMATALDVYVGSDEQTVTGVTFVSGNTALLPNTGTFGATDGTVTVFVKTVTFTSTVDAATITVDINRYFTVNVK